MNPRVTAVEPQTDYRLKLTFTNGEVRVFDVTPYLSVGVFQPLRNRQMFDSVRPVLGSIQWNNGADLCPDTLYEKSRPLPKPKAKPRQLQVAESRARYSRKRR